MRSLLPRLGRATALLLLALWAVEPVATWVHYGDHTHLYCPSHQTFEEGRRAESAGLWVPAAHMPELIAGVPLGAEPASQKHEACSFPLCGTRQLAVPGPTRTLVRGTFALQAAVPAPCSVPAPPLSVLDIAPKASPPSRA